MPPSPEPKGAFCPDCRGHRLHRVRLSGKKAPGAVRVYVVACTACERESPVPPRECPGISCPRCSSVSLQVVYTRHRTGQTVRVKRCRHCGHRVRTREVVESLVG